MTTHHSSAGDPIAQAGVRRRRAGVGLALACLVLVGLTQPGCRSDGCSTCGGFGSRLTSSIQGVGARVFNRNHGGCSTCGTLGSVPEEGVVVDGGMPMAAPGAIVTAPGGVVVPTPPAEPAAIDLKPLPAPADAGAPPATSSRRGTTAASRSSYDPTAPRNVVASTRTGTPAREFDSPPTPAGYSPEGPDILSDFPPVKLPTDLAREVPPAATTPPAAVPRSAATTPEDPPLLPDTAPAATPPGDSTPKTSAAGPRPAGEVAVARARTGATPAARATPGIARAASVAPATLGGSLPSAEGLAWLKEKGFRTLVDLRPRAEVDPAFPDLVSDAGMLYVAIPFATDPIKADRLARFNELISQSEGRPLFFCDNDGRRAGLAWYLRLRSLDHEEKGSALAKAEELGLLPSDVDPAEAFLKRSVAQVSPEVIPTSLVAPAAPEQRPTAIAAVVVAPTPIIDPVPVSPIPRPEPVAIRPTSDVPPAAAVLAAEPGKPAFVSNDAPPRSASWKPVAAMVLGGLGVPLAYWSHSSLSQRRTPRRASLMAKGPGPRRSLPGSDA